MSTIIRLNFFRTKIFSNYQGLSHFVGLADRPNHFNYNSEICGNVTFNNFQFFDQEHIKLLFVSHNFLPNISQSYIFIEALITTEQTQLWI